jgi:hypothetical protein
LHYLIGNEKKYMQCDDTVATADFSSENYTTDKNGLITATLKFDPTLAGHEIVLFANYLNNSKKERVGISKKDLLLLNSVLTKEYNEDDTKTVDNGDGTTSQIEISHTDGLWERNATNGSEISGSFTIGFQGGANSTDLGDNTTLAKDVNVTLNVITPDVCNFKNGNDNLNINTDCNGKANFEVKYKKDGICKIQFGGFNYDY